MMQRPLATAFLLFLFGATMMVDTTSAFRSVGFSDMPQIRPDRIALVDSSKRRNKTFANGLSFRQQFIQTL